MKARWIMITGCIVCFSACEQPEKPSGKSEPVEAKIPLHFFFEAESFVAPSEVSESSDASGNAFVAGNAGSSELLRCEIPVSIKPLSVWLRRKGGAVSVATEGSDIFSIDQSETQFVWTFFGEISPGAEGRQLSVTSGSNGNETIQIDCVLFSESEIPDKDALLTPLSPLRIDTQQTMGDFREARDLWGVSTASIFPTNIEFLASGTLRICDKGIFTESLEGGNGLIVEESRGWDEKKLRGMIAGLLDLDFSGKILVNLPSWPAWMDGNNDGFLDADQVGDHAQLLGRFAEIVWEFPAARSRVMFEITNGYDGIYHSDLIAKKQPQRVAELARIYLGAIARIRQVAPDARIGGPSVKNASDLGFHEQFIAITAPALDFYSVDLSASENPSEGDPSILDRAELDEALLKEIRQILDKNSPNRRIPIWLNGYGIKNDNADALSPIWKASSAISAFGAGADFASVSGQSFAPLYRLLNTEFGDKCALLETEQSDFLTALVTEDRNRIFIVHRGMRGRKVFLPAGEWTGWILEKDEEKPREIQLKGEADLPGVSLMYLQKPTAGN